MADHVLNAVVDHFVRYRHRLFRVASIVIFHDFQLVALNAAFGVNIGHRLRRTAELLIAILRNRT